MRNVEKTPQIFKYLLCILKKWPLGLREDGVQNLHQKTSKRGKHLSFLLGKYTPKLLSEVEGTYYLNTSFFFSAGSLAGASGSTLSCLCEVCIKYCTQASKCSPFFEPTIQQQIDSPYGEKPLLSISWVPEHWLPTEPFLSICRRPWEKLYRSSVASARDVSPRGPSGMFVNCILILGRKNTTQQPVKGPVSTHHSNYTLNLVLSSENGGGKRLCNFILLQESLRLGVRVLYIFSTWCFHRYQ